MRGNEKRGIRCLVILLFLIVLTLGGCGKKAEPVEKESAVATESAESSVSSEVPQETKAPEVTEPPEGTETPEGTEAAQADMGGEYDLDALFGPEQADFSGGPGLITISVII